MDLLEETRLLSGKTTNTPLDPNLKLGPSGNPLVDKGRYQRLVRRLIYLSHTRPDVTFVVSLASQFMHSLTEEHMNVVWRILCYLKSTPRKGLLFKSGQKLEVRGYTNADYKGSLVDRRSTAEYYVFLERNLVSWRSKNKGLWLGLVLKQNLGQRPLACVSYFG